MSKKNILLIITIPILLVIFVIIYFILNLEKPKSDDISLSNSSVVLEVKENPEVKNPFAKNNESENTQMPEIKVESISTITEKYSSSSSSATKKESTFVEIKKLPDGSKLFNLEGFDSSKLQGEPLIEQYNFSPNRINPKYLFVETNGTKRFLGYGAIDIFQFEVGDAKYNLTVFEDETGLPTLTLNDLDYTNQRKIYTGLEYTQGVFKQISNSKFLFDGRILNDDENTVVYKTIDIQDVHDFGDEE
jgi:hypothetical protein